MLLQCGWIPSESSCLPDYVRQWRRFLLGVVGERPKGASAPDEEKGPFITDTTHSECMAIVTNRSNVEGDRPSGNEEVPLGTFLYNALPKETDTDEEFDSVEAVREIRERDRC